MIKEIAVAHEGLACNSDIIFALHYHYTCSIRMGVIPISCLLRLELEGLLQSVLSLQVSVAKAY